MRRAGSRIRPFERSGIPPAFADPARRYLERTCEAAHRFGVSDHEDDEFGTEVGQNRSLILVHPQGRTPPHICFPTEKRVSASARTLNHGALSFETESFGEPSAPAILMIMGATTSMLWGPDELCRSLAQMGRFVIRYDNRDAGRSTTQEPGPPGYTIDDMADDAIAILDGYGLAQAHLVGMSLGGMIAQLAALKRPQRVLSLTLIGSSAFDEADPDLPSMDPMLLAHFAKIETLDWKDREAVLNFHVESYHISAGANASFDEARARSLAEREYDRALNPRSAMNHSMLAGGGSGPVAYPNLPFPRLSSMAGMIQFFHSSMGGDWFQSSLPLAFSHWMRGTN